ncbi:hypothetical protein HNQ75_002615 [Rhizobium flavum]|uniref:Uncharacterized protein n=1 Tax=Pseudorhizobium flavum TaxID=1335061 RepID=A0A7X0DD67_9HYPH|nr:hypothetical protein [Pseudorhizobium flavum]CAD6615743.1 hypothetical protein RFYW14_02957 [Pseudorhizobium flavum]
MTDSRSVVLQVGQVAGLQSLDRVWVMLGDSTLSVGSRRRAAQRS